MPESVVPTSEQNAETHGTPPTADPPSSADDHKPAQPVTYATLLRDHNFFRLWLGATISIFGSRFTSVAIPIYVFKLTNSYSALGFTMFCNLIAALLFGLFGGALVDRWDRRRTMVATDIGNGILIALLLAYLLMPVPNITKLYGIYALNFLSGLLAGVSSPARIAILPEIVPQHLLLRANALDRAMRTFGELISYPLAVILLSLSTPEIVFGLDAVTFLFSALLIWGIRTTPQPHDPEGGSILAEIREGLTVAMRLPLVRELVILSLIVPFNLSLFNTLQLPYAVDALHSTEEVAFPMLEGAMALGVVVGMLLLGRWGQHIKRTTLLSTGIAGAGLTVAVMGLVPRVIDALSLSGGIGPWTIALLATLPLAMLSGATNSLIMTGLQTMLQEQTPRAKLGRVASVVGVAANTAFAGGALFTGLAQGRVALVITLIGIVLFAIGAICRWWLPWSARRPAPGTEQRTGEPRLSVD